MTSFTLTPDYLPASPKNPRRWGIGLVGCGEIARLAHLPAYTRFGYRVESCFDIDASASLQVGQEFDIPVASTLEALLDNENVDIIDLPVPTRFRHTIIAQICAHPRKLKAILSQKPFADSLESARSLVEMCEKAGIVLMINQQARWAPGHRALKQAIERGDIGPLYSVLNIIRSWQDDPTSWFVKTPDFNILDHGIHWIDLLRFFTGRDPVRVFATTTMKAGQCAVSPMIYTINFEFAATEHLMATLHFNNIIPAFPQTSRWEWLVDGEHGTAHLNDTLKLVLSQSRECQVFEMEGQWFPDAFGGSMGELMSALDQQREPQCSGRDNLKSLELALAAVKSARTGQSVHVGEGFSL